MDEPNAPMTMTAAQVAAAANATLAAEAEAPAAKAEAADKAPEDVGAETGGASMGA